MKAERQRVAAIGDAWVFKVKKGKPLWRAGARSLWRRIAEKAKIPDGEGHGWYSCRRSFANRMRHASLRELKDLGGWKTGQTVVSVDQHPSESAQREALLAADLPPTGTTNGPQIRDITQTNPRERAIRCEDSAFPNGYHKRVPQQRNRAAYV